jgi:hypothetical protein
MMVVILVIGAASMLAYLWRRQWVDAALVLVATAALGGLAAHLRGPAPASPVVETLSGDGLRASQWDDVPARPLRWTAPDTPTLRPAFPPTLALGRMFTLTVRRDHPVPARLQLLDENSQVLASAAGTGDLTVQWLPPVAEKLVLRARLLDAAGKVIDQGPVPLVVQASVPLKVEGRFDAPSFDVRALEEQLVASHVAVDWEVTLGRAITRTEKTVQDAAPDLAIVDAAWFEHAAPAVRNSMLARVAKGMPLLILAGNAANTGLWSQVLQLPLAAQADGKTTGGPMPLAVAPFNPASANVHDWHSADNIAWTRTWQQGRITWLGGAGWHRYAITQPQALAAWWQGVVDTAGVRREQSVTWLAPGEMPLPDQRLAVCAQGVKGDAEFTQLAQTLAWQRRADHVDAACVAVWPRKPGWLTVQTGATRHDEYVYASEDWPLWQRAQRRDATVRYLARKPVNRRVDTTAPSKHASPFAIVFALAMLLLWWRERR